jgi:hypothetical protein
MAKLSHQLLKKKEVGFELMKLSNGSQIEYKRKGKEVGSLYIKSLAELNHQLLKKKGVESLYICAETNPA